MTGNAQGEAWPLHHGPMFAAYQRFLRAMSRRKLKSIVSDDPKIEAEIIASMASALRIYSRTEHKRPLMVFPHEIALFLADLLDEALSGAEPESLRCARKARTGRPVYSTADAARIRSATIYLAACRDGVIRDRSPNKRIREAYKVDATTVRDWARTPELAAPSNYQLLTIQPNAPKGKSLAQLIVEMMEADAENFRESRRTRSADAQASRPKKRVK
jgi:hypothetical protein